MAKQEKLRELYFKWLTKFVCDSYQSKYYGILLGYLFNKEFYWSMEFDENCAIYGMDLRDRFYEESPVAHKYYEMYGDFITGPCSILELMVSLSIQCEDRIMTNGVDDNTSKWFWIMIESLGLDIFDDGRWDEYEVEIIIQHFLDRKYRKDGKGGLFWVKNSKENLREMEIWWQMNLYIRDFVEF